MKLTSIAKFAAIIAAIIGFGMFAVGLIAGLLFNANHSYLNIGIILFIVSLVFYSYLNGFLSVNVTLFRILNSISAALAIAGLGMFISSIVHIDLLKEIEKLDLDRFVAGLILLAVALIAQSVLKCIFEGKGGWLIYKLLVCGCTLVAIGGLIMIIFSLLTPIILIPGIIMLVGGSVLQRVFDNKARKHRKAKKCSRCYASLKGARCTYKYNFGEVKGGKMYANITAHCPSCGHENLYIETIYLTIRGKWEKETEEQIKHIIDYDFREE